MTEGKKIETMPDLTRHIIDHWRKKQEEALSQQKEQEEKLRAAVQEEKELTAKLKESKLIAEKLELEYLRIEARTEGEKRAQIEVNSIREKDVLEGRVTLAEFYKTGKTKEQIYNEMVKETIKEMGQSLQTARKKRLEILELEKSLLETQTKIRYLIIEPGRTLQRSLKDLAQFAEREIGFFLEEVHNSKTALTQIQGKLYLTEGKSLTPGYSWNRLTIEQAYRLQFDPILPLECIAALKSKLELYKDVEKVNVTFFLRTKKIDVSSVYIGGKK